LLRSSVTTGRVVLQRILRGRITFVPRLHVLDGSPDGYEFHAQTRFDCLRRALPPGTKSPGPGRSAHCAESARHRVRPVPSAAGRGSAGSFVTIIEPHDTPIEFSDSTDPPVVSERRRRKRQSRPVAGTGSKRRFARDPRTLALPGGLLRSRRHQALSAVRSNMPVDRVRDHLPIGPIRRGTLYCRVLRARRRRRSSNRSSTRPAGLPREHPERRRRLGPILTSAW
jgi:hypothetical protein